MIGTGSALPQITNKMINDDVRAVVNHRWMRCINANDLSDYVDISIGSGSNTEERLAVLNIADFIGGDWRGSIFEKGVRVKYDYYYIYSRNKDYSINGDDNVGQHRNGDFVMVNRKTNEIIKQWPEETLKKISK